MFKYIDLNNLQKYFDDAGLDHLAPVNHTGSFVEVSGQMFNFIDHKPGTFNVKLLRDDTFALSINQHTRHDLKYDENNRCKVERRHK